MIPGMQNTDSLFPVNTKNTDSLFANWKARYSITGPHGTSWQRNTGGSVAGAAEAVNTGLSFATILLRAVGNGVGEMMVQNPAIAGWLFVMIGLVFVWNGVYRQLLQQPTRI